MTPLRGFGLVAREPAKCERAYPEFLELYDQMTRKPLYALGC